MRAAAAVSAFHDYALVSAQGARALVVCGGGVREAGGGSVGVFEGRGGGDGVEGTDVGYFENFAGCFGEGGEGADGFVGMEGLQGADLGVDESEVGGGGAGVDGPVEVDDAWGVGVCEEGMLLSFVAWMGGGFAD